MPIKPQSPLEEFVLNALNKQGFEKLKDADQEMFFPQYMAEAERRLGLAMAPYFTAESAEEFKKLSMKTDSTSEEWFAFWTKSVPNFMEVLNKTLADFATELNLAVNA